MRCFLTLLCLVALRAAASAGTEDAFPQQDAMEGFADGIIGNSQIVNEKGSYLRVDEWDGVRVSHGSVIRIRWNKKGLSGVFEFSRLPDSLSTIVIAENDFTGSIASLPADLEFLSCEENRFSGTIEWEHLPANMIFLDVRQNQLTGEIDLLKVSKTLESVYIRKNSITVVNQNAHGAWKGSGDVITVRSSNRRSMMMQKKKQPDVKPVSESVPVVSEKSDPFAPEEHEGDEVKKAPEGKAHTEPKKAKSNVSKYVLFGLFWAVVMALITFYAI
mmetsp:Transcript_11200/g.16940  ORF Transcript_11200/g.16940 Transcript_11200/m.16940 type:complete len:274 (-) Transcript_11200:51-872(-)